MEKQLFNWDAFDIITDDILVFYGCTLGVDIGKHKVGIQLDSISINYATGILEMYNGDGTVISTHQLELKIK
jgi:hypothetical protein